MACGGDRYIMATQIWRDRNGDYRSRAEFHPMPGSSGITASYFQTVEVDGDYVYFDPTGWDVRPPGDAKLQPGEYEFHSNDVLVETESSSTCQGSALTRQTTTDAPDRVAAISSDQSPATAEIAPRVPPRPASSLDRSLDAIVQADSRSWVFNRYDVGSMSNARVISRSKPQRSVVIYGEYTFNGGSRGWIKARIKHGVVACVQFWDGPSCRSLGQPASQALLGALLRGAMSGGGGSSGSGRTTERDQENRDFYASQRAIQATQDQVDRMSEPHE